jgi:hypothetical protein
MRCVFHPERARGEPISCSTLASLGSESVGSESVGFRVCSLCIARIRPACLCAVPTGPFNGRPRSSGGIQPDKAGTVPVRVERPAQRHRSPIHNFQSLCDDGGIPSPTHCRSGSVRCIGENPRSCRRRGSEERRRKCRSLDSLRSLGMTVYGVRVSGSESVDSDPVYSDPSRGA